MSEEMLGARIPEELKQLVDADSRTNQEIVVAALWREFGGKRKSVVEAQLEQKESRLKSLHEEQDELAAEADRLEAEVTALRERVDTLDGGDDAIEAALDDLLDDLEAKGTHIWADAEPIQALAREHGLQADDVFSRLKHRAAIQDRDMEKRQFFKKFNEPDNPHARVSEVWK
jgi:predicted nuclease with TOPRIM domain